jgi:hypothetical protein
MSEEMSRSRRIAAARGLCLAAVGMHRRKSSSRQAFPAHNWAPLLWSGAGVATGHRQRWREPIG